MPPTRLTLPWPPALNRLYRTYMGRILLSREGRAWKEQAGWFACAAGTKPLQGPVAVQLVLYRPRKRGDIDGYSKALLDAMQGHLYLNDDQIVELHVYRMDDKINPRVTVTVQAAVPVPPEEA